MELMKKYNITSLLGAFSALDRSVRKAREVLEQSATPDPDSISRLKQYEDMIQKQKLRALEACDKLGNGQWAAAAKDIQLLHALAQMVRDDARTILENHDYGDIIEGTIVEFH